ncbi:MAG TPA: glycoside hydrolase family 44 protein [Planctomycetota bacterium]|nr:glycoside hydrolase family 44 protein [Planctomycetota bacterium]
MTALLALLLSAGAFAGEQDPPLTFQVDGKTRAPISPYVYGANHPKWDKDGWTTPLSRAGGNRLTAYNWETNASNAGSDWQHQNDNLMGTDVPGEAMRKAVAGSFEHGAAIVMTVPIIGRVAADKNGGGDVNKTPDYLHKRFFVSLPKKEGAFSETPDLADGKVYQDEFVAWLEKKFSGAHPPIFYCMDNEPELWASTHARIHPEKVRFDEIVRLNTDYASAVKRVAPKALVFGFVSYGWHGLTTLQDAPDRNNRDFSEFFLQEMAAAEKKAGKRLVDVFDFHWYPEARGGKHRITDDDASPETAAARIQSTRSLWDPSYKESSWVANSAGGAIRLLPRLREKIEQHYPGTKLAMTEYYYGGGDHISGGLAQADVLGILGREGVFAAALWHLGRTNDRFIHGASMMFRNYDGKDGAFGDTGLGVSGGDPARASLYASLDAQKRTVIVAINKTEGPLPVKVDLKDVAKVKSVAVYRLTAADAKPVAAEDLKPADPASLSLELPPLSVSTLVLKP